MADEGEATPPVKPVREVRRIPREQEDIDRFSEWRQRQFEDRRLLMRATNNPLHAWHVIKLCHHPNYPPCPLPEWCLEYLLHCASELGVLADLKNIRTYPEFLPNEDEAAGMARFLAWEETAAITPDRAMAQLPWALMLQRQGWNAFSEFNKDQQLETEAAFYDNPGTHARREILKWIIQRNNLSDENSARRRIARGRRLLRPKPDKAEPPP